MQTNLSRRRFGYRLVGLSRRWRRHLDDRLARVGLSDASWVPLVHLLENGDGMHQKDLAAAIGLDGSSLVRLLDLLETRGLIERCVDEEDRRARRIRLTRAGHEVVTGIRGTLCGIEDDLLADLDEQEIAAVLTVFDRIEQRLKAGAGRGAVAS